ncbi:MAG: hypothetical protein EBR82_41045 [Caulobacteraceae bacterium]|nr:hypothetical protein [Caulobacteraceae bacterium]NDD03544.1 hypothetical protein [Pseudomonadota bacterium]NDG19945.1 hypothetical protein [Betaproteobacteria bacterium]
MSVDFRKRLLGANDIKVQPIEVPEWGGTWYVRVLSGRDREAFEEALSAEQRMKNFRIRFLILAICDENGAKVFDQSDVDFLGDRNSVVINRVFEQAWTINAFTKEAVDALGEDSPADPSGDSSSASPSA